jgi:glycolate dehydrogenase FAD-linked subunit
VIPKVREEWTAIADRYIDKYGIFDNWGIYCYTSASYKPWGDYLAEIDIGIWEERLNDETWAGWVDFKSEIAKVSLKYGGSITNCHGSTRAGDAELVPEEMGGGWDVMLKIKAALDPNNIMNPGKQMLDQAYES